MTRIIGGEIQKNAMNTKKLRRSLDDLNERLGAAGGDDEKPVGEWTEEEKAEREAFVRDQPETSAELQRIRAEAKRLRETAKPLHRKTS
jgi:hypothetical protein